MAGSRAERLARRTASAAIDPPAGRPRGHPRGGVSPERRVDPEPYVEHPEDNDDGHAEDDLGEEEASSLHPSRDRAASSLGRPAPSPANVLLMAQELLQYRPTPEAQEAWLNRLSELVGAARVNALSAQWKPGYHGPACQGPQHLLKISLRTRLSKPGEAPQA